MENMENTNKTNQKKQIIHDLIKEQEWDALLLIAKKMPVIDIVEVLYDLEDDVALDMLKRFSLEEQGRIVNEFDRERQMKLFKLLDRKSFIAIFANMASDVRADLYQCMNREQQLELLSSLDEKTRENVKELSSYDPETAGGIMSTEYVSLKANMTTEEAIRKIRNIKRNADNIFILYVIDDNRILKGKLSLGTLVSANKDARVGDIMLEEFARVNTSTDQEEVARLLKHRDLVEIPVVNEKDRLVGVVTVDDAIDVLEEETTDDIFDKVGLADIAMTRRESSRSEQLVKGPLKNVLKVRVPFLIITLIGGMLAGAVIDVYEATLEAIAAVAIFIPVIMDMGGNVGTQSSTIFTRALVLGHINMKHFRKHLFREMGIGISIGVIMGAAALAIATLWQGNIDFGYAVGISLALTMTLATTLGFLIPWVLVKLGFDQAAGSDPFITTVKDVTGLFIYFTSVSIFLGYLL